MLEVFAVLPAARFAMPAMLAIAVVAACGGGATPTISPTAGAQSTPIPAASTPAGGSGDFTAVCRDLDNLHNLDYAYGQSFNIVSTLEDSSKALTLQHVQAFAAEAPPELATAAADLVGLWTDLVNDSSSVTESDPRWAEATDSINAWRTQNCA